MDLQPVTTTPNGFCAGICCLDNCERGPSCVVYPEGTWYTLPDDDDGLKAVLEHLKGGEPASDYLMGD
jgi:(2Fe-2S) ferredoxin